MAGMVAIFDSISTVSGKLKCLDPLMLLPRVEGVGREDARERARLEIYRAMERAS